MKTFLLAMILAARFASAQTSDAPTGRNHPLTLTVPTNTGAHSASTVFTAPSTGLYVVQWSLRTTATCTLGTLSGLTFAWNNTNAISRNVFLIGPQLLDLSSLTSTGLTSAEITGTQPMFVNSGTAVTWATAIGTGCGTGTPNYIAEFRVVAY
jgi:hypothetical protein